VKIFTGRNAGIAINQGARFLVFRPAGQRRRVALIVLKFGMAEGPFGWLQSATET